MIRRSTRPTIAVGIMAALVIFVLVAGTATASAWWSASGNLSSTATAASAGVSHSLAATPSLAVTYTSASLVAVGVITVTNSSTRSGTYSTTLNATSASSTLRAAVAVEMGTAPSCTATATLAEPQTGTFATAVTYSGSLAAGASVALCVRTAMTAAGVSANSAATVSVTASTTVLVGAWSAVAAPTLSFTQTVTTAPSRVVDPDAWYFIKRSTGEIRCAESKDFGTASGTQVQTVDCNTLATNQLWRFTPTTGGYYAITNKNSPSLRWNVDNAENGAALVISTTTGTNSEWSVTGGSGSTAIIAVRSDSRLCASTDPNNGNRKAVKIKTCVSGYAEQALSLIMLGVANPAPIALQCVADGYNATYSWPQLTGYESEVTYRVVVGGIVTTSYTRGTAYDPTVAFASAAALASFGEGTKTVEVQQKLASGVWHRVGTGTLMLRNTVPYLACGA